MLEQSLKLNPKALRPDERIRRNSQYLVKALNVEASPFGLISYNPVEHLDWDYLNTVGVELNFPYPQLFKGKKNNFLLTRDRIFILAEDGELLELDVYDYDSGTITTIEPGMLWSFTDFYDQFMFHNGVCSLWTMNLSSISGYPDRVYVEKGVRVNTGCAFRGRVIMAGFDPWHNYSEDWNTFMTTWAQAIPTQAATTYDLDFKENFVWWSSIGADDALMLFQKALTETPYSNDGYDANRLRIFESIKKNSMGWMPMPYQGSIIATKELGGDIAVYGEQGVSFLRPSGHLFGLVEAGDLSHTGIASHGAVGGDDKVHLAIDQTGVAWLIESGAKVTRIGYEEYLGDIVNSNVVVSYTATGRGQRSGTFHISNGYRTFVLNSNGLTETSQVVTSKIYMSDGYVRGIAHDINSDIDQTAEITTSNISINNERAINTITWVEVESNNVSFSDMYVKLYYRVQGKAYDANRWDETSWQVLNWKGASFFGISAIEFRLGFKCEDFSKFNAETIVFRYQTPDRTTKRGTTPISIGGSQQ